MKTQKLAKRTLFVFKKKYSGKLGDTTTTTATTEPTTTMVTTRLGIV